MQYAVGNLVRPNGDELAIFRAVSVSGPSAGDDSDLAGGSDTSGANWVEEDRFDPRLKDMRGKIVLIQQFGGPLYGLQGSHDTRCDLDAKDDYRCLSAQDWSVPRYSGYLAVDPIFDRCCGDGTVDNIWGLYDKWTESKDHIARAESAYEEAPDNHKIYFTALNGSVGGFPYFFASGHSSPGDSAPRLATGAATPFFGNTKYPDFPRVTCWNTLIGDFCTIAFEGMNILTQKCLTGETVEDQRPSDNDEKIARQSTPICDTTFTGSDGNFSRVGMVSADFPGKTFIEAVANVNDGIDLGGPNEPPEAGVNPSAYIVDEGSVIEFDASSPNYSSDPDGNTLFFRWASDFPFNNCVPNDSGGQAIQDYVSALEAWIATHPGSLNPEQEFAETDEGIALQKLVDLESEPSSTAKASYTCFDDGSGNVEVTVTDGIAEDTASASVIVNNVAPTASIDAITDEAGNVLGQDVDIALVGLELGMEVSFADVGTLDTHTVAID